METYAVQFRRGTSLDHDLFTGRDGELTVDTTTWTVRVHDGITPGGHNAARVDLGNVNLTDLRDRMNAIGDGSAFVRLDDLGRLPAIDGSQLLNLPGTNLEALREQIIQELKDSGLLGDNMPSIGSVKMGYASPGDDYILADGSLYNRADYPLLANSISERFNIEAGNYNVYWPTVSYDLINQNVLDVATSGSVIVAVGSNGGFWRSADDGRSFTRGQIAALSGQSLNEVIFAKGLFITIGSNGALATSADGLNWTVRNSNTTNAISQIALLNGTLLATAPGTTGTILTSNDGITWTTGTAPAFAGASVNALGFFAGLYVIAGSTGLLATSPDLQTWTVRAQGHSNPITALASNAAGTVMVAVGGTGTVGNVTSTADGQTWTTRTSASAQARTCVIWWPALSAFVCGGNAGTVMTSPDGVTWTAQSTATTALSTSTAVTSLLDRGAALLAVNASGVIAQATALATWASKATGRGPLVKLVPGATTLGAFAFGTSTSGAPSISKSLDNGATWYFLATGLGSNAARFPSGDGTMNLVTIGSGGVYSTRDVTGRTSLTYSGISVGSGTAYLNGKFWAFGAQGGLTSSIDGVNWTANFSLPNTVTITKMGYGNGVYVAIGSAGAIYSSIDGETFLPVSHTLGTLVFKDVLFSNGGWIVTNTTTANVLYSTDGLTFFTKAAGLATTLGAIVANGSMVIWNSSTAAVSTNGGATFSTAIIGSSVLDMTYGNGMFMAVGGASSSSFCAVSPDGLSWTTRTVPYAGSLTTVAFSSGAFLVTGTPAGVSVVHLETSTNGAFWTVRASIGGMPQAQWITVPNFGAFCYGVTNGGSAPDIIVPFPSATQFRVPSVPPTNTMDGSYFIKAR
jgi:hypothetical protein